jgi:hypothetical protein
MAGISSFCIVISLNTKWNLLWLSGLALLMVICFAIHIWWQERKRVYNMPKKAMLLCDKHGAYPEDASLHIDATAEDRADLKVQICPLCYAERLKEIERKLK